MSRLLLQAWTRSEAGLASVLVLALTSVLALLATAAVALGQVAVLRHRAASAADLAALAASDRSALGPTAACAAAARLVTRDLGPRGELTRCEVPGPGLVVSVTTRIRPAGLLGTLGAAEATALAGP